MSQDYSHPVPHTIAVVEDDEDLRGNVCSFLERSGFGSWGAESAEDFYVQLLHRRADLVLVDLRLPGESGQSLVDRLTRQHVPVVVLTARCDLPSRIELLGAGALQYFVKPADLHELVAGIRSQLRRAVFLPRAEATMVSWSLDQAQAVLVAPNQRNVKLTSREMELLVHLIEVPGTLVSKQALIDAMGGGDPEDLFHRVESRLTRLRRKTLQTTGLTLPVRSVFGRGLVFVP